MGGLPEGGGQAEFARGGLEGHGGGAIADEGGDALGPAEVGLLDDAGLAVDAFGDGDVVVGVLALGAVVKVGWRKVNEQITMKIR